MNDESGERVLKMVQAFIAGQHSSIPLVEFLVNLGLAALLGWLLAALYARFGTSFSNRRQFGKNFILLCMTTMLIISIVKSSLALSLGLVGALSIVRFRAAIKDPEELVFLFVAISIGLGLGASQIQVTLLGTLAICLVIVIRGYAAAKADAEDVSVSISAEKGRAVDPNAIAAILRERCSSVAFKRLEEDDKQLDMAFTVTVGRFNDLVAVRDALSKIAGVSRIVLLDSQGVAY